LYVVLHKSESGVSASKFSVQLPISWKRRADEKVAIDGKLLEFTVKDFRQMAFLLRQVGLACCYNTAGFIALQLVFAYNFITRTSFRTKKHHFP